MKYLWKLTITDGKHTSESLYDHRREAVNAKAAWSIRCYQLSGNFDHDQLATIRRVAA
jgi:hypothetical protein